VTQLLGGRYAIERRIGEGGMAEVFLARDQAQSDAPVVVKRCRAHLAYEPDTAKLFLREARLASLIIHPNVVRVDATGEQDGQPYLVMEYLQGLTVRDVFVRAMPDGGVPQDIAAAIVLGVARGLEAAHSALDEQGRPMGLVHRDVSPHNLFVTDAGQVKVLDFGIAKGAFDVTTTRAGHVKGKASYLAPEQLDLSPDARPIDARVDLFALGIVAWELFTGKRLFKRGTEADTIAAIRTAHVADPMGLRPELDAGYAATIMRMLARDPDERPSQAQEVVDTLEATLSRRAPDLGEAALSAYVGKLRDRAPPEQRPVARSFAPPPPPPVPVPRPPPVPAIEESTATVAPPHLAWKGLGGGPPPPVDGSVVGTWAVAGAGNVTPDMSGGFDPLADDYLEGLPLPFETPPPPEVQIVGHHPADAPAPLPAPPAPFHVAPTARDTTSSAAGQASALERILHARPPPWLIAAVLAGSLLAGLVLSFVIATLLG
jgi:serine/threonine protein kinase